MQDGVRQKCFLILFSRINKLLHPLNPRATISFIIYHISQQMCLKLNNRFRCARLVRAGFRSQFTLSAHKRNQSARAILGMIRQYLSDAKQVRISHVCGVKRNCSFSLFWEQAINEDIKTVFNLTLSSFFSSSFRTSSSRPWELFLYTLDVF